jgi:protein-serine/threonine kinase
MAVSARSLSRSSSRQDIKSTKPSPTQSSKPADYVYFDRTTTGFSDEAVPRAKAAQLKLEHYYKVAVDAAIERNTRFSPLSLVPPSFITDNRIQGASSSRGDCKRTR